MDRQEAAESRVERQRTLAANFAHDLALLAARYLDAQMDFDEMISALQKEIRDIRELDAFIHG